MKEGIESLDKDDKVWRKISRNNDLATFNPFKGCRFDCYGGCWASIDAKKLQNSDRDFRGYDNGFKPTFIEEKLEKKRI